VTMADGRPVPCLLSFLSELAALIHPQAFRIKKCLTRLGRIRKTALYPPDLNLFSQGPRGNACQHWTAVLRAV